MKHKEKGLITVLIVLLSISIVYGEIRVVSVKGRVAYKVKNRWQTLRPLMRLAPGTKISTGLRSSAVLQLNKHRVTINSMTMVKIYENSMKKLTSKTRIGIRRGSIKAKVFRTKRVKTVFKVSTPVATSSVRGTEEKISFGPSKGMMMKVPIGEAVGENKNGSKKYISGRLVYLQRPGTPNPDPLLWYTRDQSLTAVYFSNVTSAEQDANNQNGDDVVDTTEGSGSGGFLKDNSRVILYIDWN